LLNHILEFAQSQLGKRGELAPFGASVDLEGQLQMVAVGEHMPSAAMLEMLVRVTADQRASLRAVAFASDVRLKDGGDAIRCESEHRDGVAIDCLLPYRKKRFGRGIDYGELQAAPGTPRVWDAPPT
jgi:hypothetical protein